ncbi:MAG: class I mannose-6-phosphate isomerase [Terriglobia bacterium]
MLRLPSKALGKDAWGAVSTAPWFENPRGLKIGEIWFETSPEVPVLVKLLFTSDKLSIQVHPGDEYAQLHEKSRGKTEMWHVLRAEPDSKVGIGLQETVSEDRLRSAIATGEIAGMLKWVPAAVGDTFFVPAGTIHAIGGGLVICEVQQFSDVTYRLHDYGRGRELHIEKAIDVSERKPFDGRATPAGNVLVECEYFRTERLPVKGSLTCPPTTGPQLYIAVAGQGTIAGVAFGPGEAWEISAGEGPLELKSGGATFIVVTPAQTRAERIDNRSSAPS